MNTRKLLIGLELIAGIAGWLWFAALGATVYFLVRAIFYHETWWHFVLSFCVAFSLYHISLAYQLERNRVARDAAAKSGIQMFPGQQNKSNRNPG